MVDLSGISLASLIERDGVTLHGQSERYGACPKCGGRDRFHLRSYNGREYFFCRQCHEPRGDAVEYLRWMHGLTYGDALRALGVRGDRPALPAARKPKPTTARGVAIPDELEDPPSVEWQAAMCAYVDDCVARLWTPTGARALDYLRGRGLGDDVIRCFRLGFSDRDDRVAGTWRGVTIPTFYGGHLWSVNTRRATGEPKYKKVCGSRAQLFNGDALASDDMKTVVVCAGEFDAMLAQQHAPAGVACVTYGSESKGITWEADYLLRGKRVLIAYDNDQAGDQGAARWAAFGERVHVPGGAKDLTDYAKGGGDVSAWLCSLITNDDALRAGVRRYNARQAEREAPTRTRVAEIGERIRQTQTQLERFTKRLGVVEDEDVPAVKAEMGKCRQAIREMRSEQADLEKSLHLAPVLSEDAIAQMTSAYRPLIEGADFAARRFIVQRFDLRAQVVMVGDARRVKFTCGLLDVANDNHPTSGRFVESNLGPGPFEHVANLHARPRIDPQIAATKRAAIEAFIRRGEADGMSARQIAQRFDAAHHTVRRIQTRIAAEGESPHAPLDAPGDAQSTAALDYVRLMG
jgi:hypothetical protein